jgi:hypothetical protein
VGLSSFNPQLRFHRQHFPAYPVRFLVAHYVQVKYFPAQYRLTGDFLHATDAYAPRQVQFALRLTF